ncbi:MAG: histidine kinase, partial [Silicimonas sp.]|nr:histidine kinase [Silicimonas sp.]
MGKVLVSFIVLSAVLGGALMYYLQVYGFYEDVPASGVGDVQLTTLAGGVSEPILSEKFKAIDAESSPLRYRACFETPMSEALLTETYALYDAPVPLTAPGWFDCYDAVRIGEALEAGEATAYLGTANITYGFDRVVAIFPDGTGFVWHQINRCG